jgi:hypothetical protein
VEELATADGIDLGQETRKTSGLDKRRKKVSVWAAAHVGSSVCGASRGPTRSAYRRTLSQHEYNKLVV